MQIALVRIDSRLVHGQVIEAWLPFTGASEIVVVDDRTASDFMMKEVMKMAVPPDVDLFCSSVKDFVSGCWARGKESKRVLVLCRDLKVALSIVKEVPGILKINVGNLHYETGKKRISSTVFFDADDERIVRKLKDLGVQIDVKAVPSDREIDIELK
ncbi:MAG: PTS transporter subunit IIB [Deltaproteobacteria bacterium]|nr:PTS transporter subunit IIB [Deltaproteobacteria bacterium]NIS78563.1 PTS transporter subunit IIB [Deltaproteobacteria bacterium]